MTKPPPQSSEAHVPAILGSSALLDGLDPTCIGDLLGMARRVHLERGQVYQTRGAGVEGVVMVAEGFLRVSLSNTDGKRHVVRHLGPGQVFNLLPVVDGGPAIHDAEAGTDTELVVLPKESFRQLQGGNPALNAAAQRLLNARARLPTALAAAAQATVDKAARFANDWTQRVAACSTCGVRCGVFGAGQSKYESTTGT